MRVLDRGWMHLSSRCVCVVCTRMFAPSSWSSFLGEKTISFFFCQRLVFVPLRVGNKRTRERRHFILRFFHLFVLFWCLGHAFIEMG